VADSILDPLNGVVADKLAAEAAREGKPSKAPAKNPWDALPDDQLAALHHAHDRANELRQHLGLPEIPDSRMEAIMESEGVEGVERAHANLNDHVERLQDRVDRGERRPPTEEEQTLRDAAGLESRPFDHAAAQEAANRTAWDTATSRDDVERLLAQEGALAPQSQPDDVFGD